VTPSSTVSNSASVIGSILPTSTIAVGSVVAPSTVLAPWREGAAIDARYTCSGVNVSPPLSWSPAPAGTAEIAITRADEQAPTFVHWVIAGLAPDATTIDEDEAPVGVVQAVNGAGGTGYTGPCPPQGETHTYRITVHFLDAQTELGDGADADDLLAVIDASTITEASVTGTFSRV
jgi:Raf kinase inhibitor-like YbhB/YbcL family protein